MDQEFDLGARDELLSEQLTGDEVREVLQRLGEVEFQLNGSSTVKDVVEGTGADPVAVGRALADVRREVFDDRFVQAFGDHEERIAKLETNQSVEIPSGKLQPLVDFVEEEKRKQEQVVVLRKRKTLTSSIIVAVILGGIAFVWYGSLISAVVFGPDAISISGKNGTTITKTRDGKYGVTRPDGSARAASESEKASVDAAEAGIRHWDRPVRGLQPSK